MPSLVPENDKIVHLVLNDLKILGCAYVETNEAHADQWTIVSSIKDGRYSKPVRVIAFNIAEGWARDETQDIAKAVFELGRREHPFSPPARDLVERILGIAIFLR